MTKIHQKRNLKNFRRSGIIKTALLYLWAAGLGALNLVRIFDNTFGGDECYSIMLAHMSIPQLLAETASDVHPPLFYLFLKLLYILLGDAGYVWHLAGFLPYLCLMLLACTVIRRQFGSGAAVVLMAMSSLMSAAVHMNVQVRMYSLAALMVLVSYCALFLILKFHRRRDWVLFAAASLGAAYTHYYALIAVAFFYVALIMVCLVRKDLRTGTAAVCIGTVAGYLPWLSSLLGTVRETSESYWLGSIPSLKESLVYLFDRKWWFLIFACAALYTVLRLTFRIRGDVRADRSSRAVELQLQLRIRGVG